MKQAKSKIIFFSMILIICGAYFMMDSSKRNQKEDSPVYVKVTNDNPLYIKFHEKNFEIEEGAFDYFGAIEETNGEIDPINLVYFEYMEGTYEVTYVVRRGETSKEYKKTLTVIKK